MSNALLDVSKEILSIQNLTKVFIEEAIEEKAKEFAERMIRKQILDAAAASSGGLSNLLVAAANNFEVEWNEEKVEVEIPSAKVGVSLQEIGRVKIPEIKMVLKTIAVLEIPEVVMVKRRVGDHHHVKVLKKWIKVGFAKIEVPNGVKKWTTPAYAHVPETRTRREEIKTHTPELTWREEIFKTDLPTATMEMRKEEFSIPVPKGASIDVQGFVLDSIPASNILKEIIAQLKAAEDFIEEYTEKAEELLDNLVMKVTTNVLEQIEKFEEQIDKIESEYQKIQKRLNEAGAKAEEIKKQLNNRDKEIQTILESIKPFKEALQKVEQTRNKTMQLIENIQLPLINL